MSKVLNWWKNLWAASGAKAQLKARAERWELVAKEQRERAEELEVQLKALYYKRPAIVAERPDQARRNLERLLVLAGMPESNPIWQTALSYADEHERTERETALKPDLSDAQRQYNAGRAASAYDFAIALRDLYREAQLEAKRQQGEA